MEGEETVRRNCCSVCSKEIDGTEWVCKSCAKEHGLVGKPYQEWPAWVRDLALQEQGERRYHAVWDCITVPVDDLDNQAEEPCPPVRRRPILPYAPYPTEEENRQYRRANRIPEHPAY